MNTAVRFRVLETFNLISLRYGLANGIRICGRWLLCAVIRILKTMCLMASGGRPVRGDLFVRWPCEAKNEILEVFEEAHEHEAQQGPHPFQGTCSHFVEDYQRVSVFYYVIVLKNATLWLITDKFF